MGVENRMRMAQESWDALRKVEFGIKEDQQVQMTYDPERKEMHFMLTVHYAESEQSGWSTVLSMAEVMQEALRLVAKKSTGYGGAWQEQGWMGNLARVQSKTSRLKNMLWCDFGEQSESAEETTEDTALDLLNLSVFFLINKRNGNKWGRGASRV